MKNKIKFSSFLLGSMMIFFVFCDKEHLKSLVPNEYRNDLETQSVSFDLIMPESVPDKVNDKALDIAWKNQYDNIRILKVDDKKKNKWHILFFEDDLREIESYVLELDTNNSNELGCEKVHSPSTYNLKKPAFYYCWILAEVWKDAYFNGSSFTFSQQTTSLGYFHKVIFDLYSSQGCCWQDYPGGFNDSISSHDWMSDKNKWGPYAHPVNLKMWEHANREGSSKTWDINWNNAYQGWQTITSNYNSYNWNDRVSSIDMFYKVIETIE